MLASMFRGWRGKVMIVVVVGVIAFSGLTARYFVFPRLPALPSRVDAIVELGGPGDEDRDRLALELARRQVAGYLVQSTTQEDADGGRCLPASPGVIVVCFHPDPLTTRGEARAIR